MTAKELSRHQKGIVDRYYDNLDTIMLQKVQELVTELYLAMNTPKEDKLWERVEKALVNLKIKPKLIEHIMTKRSVEVLAKNLEDWLKKPAK